MLKSFSAIITENNMESQGSENTEEFILNAVSL